MVAIDRNAILVIGDSMSDFDGPGMPGYGDSRRHHSVWTRELSRQIDPGQWNDKSKKKYQQFYLMQGGANGGHEYAVGGANSEDHLSRLKSAMSKTIPGVVVIAITAGNEKTIPRWKTLENVRKMIEIAQKANSKVLLIGFPPRDLKDESAFALKERSLIQDLKDIAKKYKISMVEDYFAPLRNAAGKAEGMADSIHVKYSDAAEKALYKNVMNKLGPLIDPNYKKVGVGFIPVQLPGFALSSDYFQGRWTHNATDWRWYRSEGQYKALFDRWKSGNGIGSAVAALRAADPKTLKGLSTEVSDWTAHDYLGIDHKTPLTADQKNKAQKLYELDLFDWWWTTPGLTLDFKDASGRNAVLYSGVLIRDGAVYEGSGKLMFGRPGRTDLPSDIIAMFKAQAPVYVTTVNGKQKAATKDTNSLFIFGDSHCRENTWTDTTVEGVWFAKLMKFLSPAEAARYRAVNYSYSGAVSGDLLMSVRAHIDEIAKTPGERTIVLAYGANDNSTAAANASRFKRGAWLRYQTNTEANLYEAAQLAASRGINVMILQGGKQVSWANIVKMAADIRLTYGVKAGALDWTKIGLDKSAGESKEGSHRTDKGMEVLVKWLLQQNEFTNTALTLNFRPAVDAAHWWRATGWMVDAINDMQNSFKTFWFSKDGYAADRDYAAEVKKAYADFYIDANQSTYDALCAIMERWWSGEAGKTAKTSVKLYFGPDAVRVGDSAGKVFDPQGSSGPPPLRNPNTKAPVFNSAGKVDASHWWRNTAWANEQIFKGGKPGSWLSYWDDGDWKKSIKTNATDKEKSLAADFAAQVQAAKATYLAAGAGSSAGKAAYSRLMSLLEVWFMGEITAVPPAQSLSFRKLGVYAGDKIFDPQGPNSGYGKLLNPAFAFKFSSKGAVDKSLWWRATDWAKRQIFTDKNAPGSWLDYWDDNDWQGLKLDKSGNNLAQAQAYALEVRKAKATYLDSKSSASAKATAYARLMELMEVWWTGGVRAATPKDIMGLKANLSFELLAVRIGKGGAVFDPQGPGKGPAALLNPAFAFKFSSKGAVDKSLWWRATDWAKRQIFTDKNAPGSWLDYWDDNDWQGLKLNKSGNNLAQAQAYALEVRKAKASYLDSKSSASAKAGAYARLMELMEVWWTGGVRAATPKDIMGLKANLSFELLAVRIGKGGAVFDPQGPGKGPAALVNPAFAFKFSSKGAVDKSLWWRATDWAKRQIFTDKNAPGSWLDYWDDNDWQGLKLDKSGNNLAQAQAYALEVRKAKATYLDSKSSASAKATAYARLMELMEVWWTGGVRAATPKDIMGLKANLSFELLAVRIGKGGAVFDPQGPGKGPAALLNPAFAFKFSSKGAVDKSLWWRATDWAKRQIFTDKNAPGSWLDYWDDNDWQGLKLNKSGNNLAQAQAYALEVRKAKASYLDSKSSASAKAGAYARLMELMEVWWTGGVRAATPKDIMGLKANLSFELLAVRIGKGGAVFDPQGPGKGPAALVNPAFAFKFSSKGAVDKSLWWRATDWAKRQIFTDKNAPGSWLDYWDDNDWQGLKLNKSGNNLAQAQAYALEVRKAKASYLDSKSSASAKAGAYARLMELMEVWWTGGVRAATPKDIMGLKANLSFELLAVRIGKGGAVFDPQGPGKGPGPLRNPAYNASATFTSKGRVDKSLWWRATSWAKDQIFKSDGSVGSWLNYWDDADWTKSVRKGATDKEKSVAAAYAAQVQAAKAAYLKAKPGSAERKSAYARLMELQEVWFLGDIKAIPPASSLTYKFEGVFAGGRIFDPQGPGKGPGPLRNPAYRPPATFTSKGRVDKSLWWRATSWAKDQIFKSDGSVGSWLNYWDDADWTKSVRKGATDKEKSVAAAYAAQVQAAKAAYLKAKPGSAARKSAYARLMELQEVWFLGDIKAIPPASSLTYKFEGVFAGGRIFDPQGPGKGPGPLRNPAYKPPATFTSKGRVDKSLWWRATSWAKDQIFKSDGSVGSWLNYWDDADWKKSVRKGATDKEKSVAAAYAAQVQAAKAAYLKAKPGSAARKSAYARLMELQEVWFLGDIKAIPPASSLTYRFEGVFAGGRIFDPQGPGKGPGPLRNPAAGKKEILVIGDSLSDEGMTADVWVDVMRKKLAGMPYLLNEQAVMSTGTRTAISGGKKLEGATERFNRALAANPKPNTIVIAIGVNNLKLGITLEQTRDDIEAMIVKGLKAGAKILLIGMYLPPELQDADRQGYISAADSAELKRQGLSNTPNGWSIALHRIYYDLYLKYKSNSNFSYINNYFDPIDGGTSGGLTRDVDQSQAALKRLSEKLLADRIHPKSSVADLVNAPIWKMLQAMWAGKQQPPTLPPFSTPIKSFISNTIASGEQAYLRFEFGAKNPVKASLRVKFWATIEDTRAGDQNHKIANKNFVNFQYFHVSFDRGTTWIKYDNSQGDVPEVVIPAGATSVIFRFSTYKKAPYDALLHANIGNPAKSYSVLIDKDPVPALYILDKDDPTPASIGDIKQGAGSHTCYFLASLQAMVSWSEGLDRITGLIKTTLDGYEVSFGQKKILVTRKEVFDTLWNAGAAKAGRSGRELWVRVLEYAWLEYSKLQITQDGSPENALELLSGRPVDQINGGSYGVDAVLSLLKFNASGKGANHHYIVVGTHETISDELKAKGLRANHAYSVVGMSGDDFVLWDPIQGKRVQVTTKELRAMSERFFITDLRNGDINPIAANFDAGGKIVIAKPQIYLRGYLVMENKNKNVDSASSYKSFAGSFGAFGRDGRKVDLVKLAKQIRDYNKAHPGSEFGRDPDSYGEDQNVLVVPVEVIENHVTHVDLQYWALTDDGGTVLLTTIRIDPKWSVSYRITRETSFGADLRLYYEPGKNLGNELLDRLQGGAVFSTQRNYELIWDSTTADPDKWQSRRRLRVSLAAEAFFFGGPEGGGLKTSGRFKGQYQIGWFKKDSASIWMTLGFDIGLVVGFGNFTSSFDELISASRRDDRADFMKHLASFLGRMPTGAVYMGPTVLWPNAMLNLTTKLADKVAAPRLKEQDERENVVINQALMAETNEDEDALIEKLRRIRADAPGPSILETFLRRFGEVFHNVKLKVETGGVWFPTDYKNGGLKGDGTYAGDGKMGSFADQLWNMLVQAWKLPDQYQALIDKADLSSFLKLAPDEAVLMMRALTEREEIWNAFGRETWRVMQSGKDGLGLGAKSQYRDFVATMSNKTQEALLFSVIETMIGTMVNWYSQTVEEMAEGKTPTLLRPPSYGAGGLESLASYSAYLATRVPDLIERALNRLLSSPGNLAEALFYLAAYYTPTVMEKILTEWQEKARASKLVEPLKDKDLSNIRREARSRAFFVAGFADSVSDSLADGADFKSIARKRGWTADVEANALRKIDGVARSNANVTDLQKIANNAYKSGMSADQKEAFGALREKSSLFGRDLARSVCLNPSNFETLISGRSSADQVKLRNALAAALKGHPSNSVLLSADDANWTRGLTADQAAVARAFESSLRDAHGMDNVEDRRAMALEFAKAGISLDEVDSVSTSLKTSAEALLKNFKLSKTNTALLLVACVPLMIAIAKGNDDQIKNEAANLMAGIATDIALGMVIGSAAAGFAAGIVFMMLGFVAPYFESEIAKNPWRMTDKWFAKAAIAPVVTSFVQKKLTSEFRKLFGNGRKSRALVFDAMSEQQVAFLAYSGVYDDARSKKGATDQSASMALFAMLLKDGVVSANSLKAGIEGEAFDISKADFYLQKIPTSRWADALAEYTIAIILGNAKTTFEVSELLAAVVNAFNAVERSGLGAYSGAQISPWLWPSGFQWDKKVDAFRIRLGVQFNGKTFEQAVRDLFNSGFKSSLFTVATGELNLNFWALSSYADIAAEAFHTSTESSDELYDIDEMIKAFDRLNAGESHSKSNQRIGHLRAALRYYAKGEYISKATIKDLVSRGLLRAVEARTYIGGGRPMATILDLDFDWSTIARDPKWGDIVGGILLSSKEDAKSTSETFRDVELGEWLINLGLLPDSSSGDDAKDLAKFLIRSIDANADLGSTQYWVLNSLIWDGAISLKGADNVLKLDLLALSGERLAQGIKSLSGSRDDVIGVEDLLRAFKYIMVGDPIQKYNGEWTYGENERPWFASGNPGGPKADLSGWIGANFGGSLAEFKGGEWRFKDLANLASALKSAAFSPLFTPRTREGSLKSLAPVVLDLDGDGLEFTSLSKSAAQFDVDGSGVRRNLAWVGQGDGLLAFDANGDGRITQMNEISFTGYKQGAKTDLEGLAAFDTNADGQLDAGDAAWKKFVIWIDENGDGTSDAGELRSLDDLGIASINLTSDGKRQNLDGATLFGTTTFTLKDGRKGSVGDVAFSVASGALSPAEIARRRDLLAQALASGKPLSAPGVFTPSVNPAESPNLMRNSGGR